MRRRPLLPALIKLSTSAYHRRRPFLPALIKFSTSAYHRRRLISQLPSKPFPFFSIPPSPHSDIPSNTFRALTSTPFCTLSSSSSSTDPPPSTADTVYTTITSNATPDSPLEKTLDSLNLNLTIHLVTDILHRLQYEEKLAFRFFTWAGNHGHYAHNRQTYNDMIDILSSTRYKTRQFGVLCDVLDHMKRKGKNSITVTVLLPILRTYTDKHLTPLRKFIKKRRIKPKAPPEIDALNLLLDALCKCSLAREAEVLFHRVKSKVTPNADTYNILFFGWCRVKDPKKAMSVLEEMILRGLPPENFTYNTAIDSFSSAGMVAEARELFEFMRTKGSTISSPTAKTYCIMIVSLAKADMMDECFKLLADMRSSGCLPDVSTYQELIEGMCSAGKIEAAYTILEDMGRKGYPPDILTYNCFLKVLCNLRKPEEAIMLCGRMVDTGCEPSLHTYHMLMTMFFEMGQPDQAGDMWDEMERRDCSRVAETYGIMIDGLFSCERAEDACFLLDEVIDRGLKLPYKMFDALMMRLSATGNLCAIHRLSDHMRRFYNVAMARRFAITQKKKSSKLRRI